MFERDIGHMERFLVVLSARHRVLASNIANAETPGFKAKDMDFRAAFREAIERVESGSPIQTAGEPDLYETPAVNPSRDGNTVSMEIEMTKMSENTILYSTMAQLLSMKLKMVRDAISSNV